MATGAMSEGDVCQGMCCLALAVVPAKMAQLPDRQTPAAFTSSIVPFLPHPRPHGQTWWLRGPPCACLALQPSSIFLVSVTIHLCEADGLLGRALPLNSLCVPAPGVRCLNT